VDLKLLMPLLRDYTKVDFTQVCMPKAASEEEEKDFLLRVSS